MGREHYEEFHEREFDSRIESHPLESGEVEDEVEEVVEYDCPTCKWDEVCLGGCKRGRSGDYEFELKEEEK